MDISASHVYELSGVHSPNIATKHAVTFIQECSTGNLSASITEPPLQFVPEIDQFVSSERKDEVREEIRTEERTLFCSAVEELELLKASIAKYRRDHHLEGEPGILEDSAEPSWPQVLREVTLAREREVGQDHATQEAKRFCTRIIDSFPAFEDWLQLLPSGDYGAVVCGLFKIVVGAAKKANEVRVTILSALADIPDWIGHATRYRDLYKQEKPRDLMKLTAMLCKAVVTALNGVMLYFNETTFKRGLKAVLQGSNYKSSLLESLNHVKYLSQKIDQEAMVLQQQRLKKADDLMDKERRAIRYFIEDRLQQQHQAITKEFTSRLGSYLANNLLHLLRSEKPERCNRSMYDRATKGIRVPSCSSSIGLEKGSTIMSKAELILRLGSLEAIAEQDIDRCLGRADTDPDRAKWIMRSDQLQDWLNDCGSRTLLINGNVESNGIFSATTFITAQLQDSLAIFPSVITLSYFCSLHHTTSGKVMPNAAGMIQSFITQLILHDISWDLTFLHQQNVKTLETGDLKVLCDTLHELFRQLPAHRLVFCMIDGITYYERQTRRSDFLYAIDSMMDMFQECDDLVVKFLLACHGRSRHVQKYVDKENVLLVPSIIDDDGQMWSKRAWDKTLGADIEGLVDDLSDLDFEQHVE